MIAGRGLKADPSQLWLPCGGGDSLLHNTTTGATPTTRRFNAFKAKPRSSAHAAAVAAAAVAAGDEDDEDEDDSLGYEDDFSSGIDLPITLDVTSG
jgi:hypothetical protein